MAHHVAGGNALQTSAQRGDRFGLRKRRVLGAF
jgi:hypothetical protein